MSTKNDAVETVLTVDSNGNVSEQSIAAAKSTSKRDGSRQAKQERMAATQSTAIAPVEAGAVTAVGRLVNQTATAAIVHAASYAKDAKAMVAAMLERSDVDFGQLYSQDVTIGNSKVRTYYWMLYFNEPHTNKNGVAKDQRRYAIMQLNQDGSAKLYHDDNKSYTKRRAQTRIDAMAKLQSILNPKAKVQPASEVDFSSITRKK